MINYGGAESKINLARPEPMLHLSTQELVDESHHGLGRRLTAGIAGEMLSRPWSTGGRTDDFDDRTRFHARLKDAVIAARTLGGAHLLMVTDDDAPLWEPLPEGQHDIKALKVLTAADATPREYCRDFADPRPFGAVDLWNVQPSRPGVSYGSTTVHHSRLVYVPGLELFPGSTAPRVGYDLAALDAYWPALRRLELALESAALGAVELSTPWLRMKGGASIAGGDDGDDALTERLIAYRDGASMARVRLLFGDDEAGRDNVALTGLRSEVLVAFYELVQAVEGFPGTALFGAAPSGFSTDDASGKATLYRTLDVRRKADLSPVIWRVHEVQFGRRIPHEWQPFADPEIADTTTLFQAGVIFEDEARERHGFAAREEPIVEATPEELAEAKAALARYMAGA